MVKLDLPLHSGDARGQIGKKIIFTKGGYARRYFRPRNPNTFAQQTARAAFKENYVMGLTQEQADLLYSSLAHLHDDRYSQLGHDHDHGGLSGLGDDDHTQYLNQSRGDARYPLIAHDHDHGALSGLGDDDHTQYLNQSRGDARYSQLGHDHDHIVIVKPSDTDRVSTTTVAIDPDLQVELGTGVYSGRFILYFLSVNATMDVKVALGGSDVGGGNVYPVMHAQGAFNGVAVGSAPTSLVEIGTTLTYGSAANNYFGLEFRFRFTKTSIDTFGVYWAQNTSNANILRLERGSMLEIFKA